MATDDLPYRTTAEGLRVELRVQPGAGRAGLDGLARLDDGQVVVKARVSAPAEGGKANAALLKLLSREWKLPKGSLSIARGATGRRKAVAVAGDPAALAARLRDWCAKQSPA